MGKERIFSIKELAEILDGELKNIREDLKIEAVVNNSRHKEKNSIFVAYKGTVTDSHDYINESFQNGSIAAIVTNKGKLGDKPGIVVKNGYKALSKLSALFAGEPSKDLLTIGITGTNGKTTIHWILYHTLNNLNSPSIRIGTLGIVAENKINKSGKVKTKNAGEIFMTTPGAMEIQNSLEMAVKEGIKNCVLETSSHALDQFRVADVYYDAAVFTNLTPDHLNYHKDMDLYFKAKIKLFEQLAENRKTSKSKIGGAIINIDDIYGQKLEKIAIKLDLPIYTFGTDKNSKIRILDFDQNLVKSLLKLEFDNKVYNIKTPFIGDYNASNVSAVFATCLSLGIKEDLIVEALKDMPAVPGRLESVGNEKIGIFVDYAHTGVGLQSVLTAVRKFVKNDLWVVFGCGGGKDHGKRPAMGAAAKENADKIVLTNDNPKNEDPEQIIKDILSSGCKPEFIELDRGKAIERTIRSAKEGDVIILAGKGHEDYQIIGNKTIPFSDKDEVLKLKNSGVF